MTINEEEEFKRWTGELGREEVREINHLVIEKVIEIGDDTPFKNFDPRTDGDWTAREYRPDLRTNRLFPTHGLRDANRLAAAMANAAKERSDLSDLRMIVLRLGGERPAFDDLDQHIQDLSEAVSSIADDIQRRSNKHPSGLARPILTTIHLRVTEDREHFDPHAHGLWHIADHHLDEVRRRLKDKFGHVWIDTTSVRSVKRAAFYVAQGLIDYRGLRSWPLKAIEKAWKMRQVRMVRKAGWLAQETKGSSFADEYGPESDQDTHTSHLTDLDGVDHSEPNAAHENAPDEAEAAKPADAAWKASLFPFLKPYRPATTLPKYTVRPTSPDIIDLERYPTLGDIQATAIAIVEAEQRDFDRKSSEVFAAYGLDKERVTVAIARTEAYFHLTLFHPGIGWFPTRQGIAWATATMDALALLKKVADTGTSELLDSYKDAGRLPDHLRRP